MWLLLMLTRVVLQIPQRQSQVKCSEQGCLPKLIFSCPPFNYNLLSLSRDTMDQRVTFQVPACIYLVTEVQVFLITPIHFILLLLFLCNIYVNMCDPLSASSLLWARIFTVACHIIMKQVIIDVYLFVTEVATTSDLLKNVTMLKNKHEK